MLQQQNVTIVGSIHLNSSLDEHKPVWPSFDTSTNTISDWLNVDRVQSRRFNATSFFLTAVETYSLSFCGFFGAAISSPAISSYFSRTLLH